MSADMFNAPTARAALLFCIATLACEPPRPPAPPRSRPDSAVASVGRIDFAIAVPAAAVRVEPAGLTLWSGDSGDVDVRLRDSTGASLPGGAMRWVSSDSDVARVTSAGGTHARVTAVGAGATD